MLPKKYRLKNKKAFDATYNQRNIVSNQYLILYRGRKKTDETFSSKVGFVLSKKFHKRAVKRNRVKRLIREACRLIIKDGKFKEKYMSMIFLPKAKSLDADFKTIKEAVSDLLMRV